MWMCFDHHTCLNILSSSFISNECFYRLETLIIFFLFLSCQINLTLEHSESLRAKQPWRWSWKIKCLLLIEKDNSWVSFFCQLCSLTYGLNKFTPNQVNLIFWHFQRSSRDIDIMSTNRSLPRIQFHWPSLEAVSIIKLRGHQILASGSVLTLLKAWWHPLLWPLGSVSVLAIVPRWQI